LFQGRSFRAGEGGRTGCANDKLLWFGFDFAVYNLGHTLLPLLTCRGSRAPCAPALPAHLCIVAAWLGKRGSCGSGSPAYPGRWAKSPGQRRKRKADQESTLALQTPLGDHHTSPHPEWGRLMAHPMLHGVPPALRGQNVRWFYPRAVFVREARRILALRRLAHSLPSTH